jgi:hypothetical protein
MYAQVKANVDKLDKKGKQRIMQLLQKSLGAPAAPAAAAPAAAAPAAAAPPAAPKPGVAKPAVDAGAPAKRGARKPAKPTQAEIDADRERIMGPGSESTVRTGKVIAESFSLYRKR